MLNFIQNNIGTIIALVTVFVIVLLVSLKMIKDKKNHVSSCGGCCANCPKSNNHSK